MPFISLAATCLQAIRLTRLGRKVASPIPLMAALLGVGTALGLVGRVDADYMQVITYSDLTGSVLNIYHKVESVEGKDDPDIGWDHYWSDSDSYIPSSNWIRISTSPFGELLNGDGRSSDGPYTDFIATLDGCNGNSPGSFISDKTRFHFEFKQGPDVIPDYNYLIMAGSTKIDSGSVLDRIKNHGNYTESFSYNSSIGATLTLTPTPEPATITLLGLGAASLIAGGRRKRRRAE